MYWELFVLQTCVCCDFSKFLSYDHCEMYIIPRSLSPKCYTFDVSVLLHRVTVKIASLCFLRLCVYQWRSSDRGRRKRPAELLLLLQRRQACPHPL